MGDQGRRYFRSCGHHWAGYPLGALLRQGISYNNLPSLGDPPGLAVLELYLSNPPGVTITSRTDENAGMNFP